MYGGVWLALVGWFVLSAAEQEGSGVRADALSGVTAVDVMRPEIVVPYAQGEGVEQAEAVVAGMDVGSLLRCIRGDGDGDAGASA